MCTGVTGLKTDILFTPVDLSVEYKTWLDLTNTEHRATIRYFPIVKISKPH